MKKYLLLCTFFTAVFAVITTTNVSSKLSSPDVGSSGDPFTNLTCAQSGCHPGTAQTATSSDVNLFIGTGSPTTPFNSSFTYTPGTSYNIAFLIQLTAGPNFPFYGFQIVSLTNDSAKAGTMIATNVNTTKVNTSQLITGNREYMGHRNAGSTKNWTFQWTAPAAGTGPVTFYYCFNVASVDTLIPQEPEGEIYCNSITIQEGTGTGIESISDKISALNIFPNPVSDEVGLSFDLKQAEKVSAQFYSLNGKLSRELFNENASEGYFSRSYKMNDIPSGIYLLQLNVGNTSVTKKIVKL